MWGVIEKKEVIEKMKTTVNFYEFERAFQDFDRFDNFGYDGLKALFEYLEDLEDDIGEEFELDVIALCCDFTRYEDIEEYLNDYGTQIDSEDYDADDEQFFEDVKEEIRENTTFIDVDGTAFIIQVY